MDAETIGKRLYRYDRIAPKIEHPDQVGQAEQAFYAEHGYLAVENVLTPDEVATARRAMEELIQSWEPGSNILQFEKSVKNPEVLSPSERAAAVRKLWRFVDHHPDLKALVTHPYLHAVMGTLLGEEVVFFGDQGLIKPPRIGREKPWHQDTAYFNVEPVERVIGCWLAIDPATIENGCMHVIPGSHLEGARPHVQDRDCQIPDDEVEVARDVAVPLEPGGCLFFSGLIHHGTPPNLSDKTRWALQYHYYGASAKLVDGKPWTFQDEEGNYIGC